MTRPGDRSLGCLSHFDGLSASADSYRFSWHLRWYYRDEGTFPMRYTVVLELEADGGYVATVPALPGCVSRGTPEMRSRETSAKRQTYTLKTVSLLATRSRPRPEENTSNSSQPLLGETTDGSIRPGTSESPAAGRFRREPPSQIVLRRADPYARVVVPDHKRIRPGTLRQILTEAGLTVERLRELL